MPKIFTNLHVKYPVVAYKVALFACANVPLRNVLRVQKKAKPSLAADFEIPCLVEENMSELLRKLYTLYMQAVESFV